MLRRITLSTQGQEIVDQMSFNQHEGVKETHFINAISYLYLRYRDNTGVNKQTLDQLASYINKKKSSVDSMVAVNGVSFQYTEKQQCEVPILKGSIVLAEPLWTIPNLKDVSDWLHQTIRSTGLDLQIITLKDISNPSTVSKLADIILIENLIEEPIEYGIYEWLVTASSLRFVFTPKEFEQHLIAIKQAVTLTSPLEALLQIERNLYDNFHCIPLFWGKEEITKTLQVRGIQVRKTGYSDFDKLWISRPD
jgi:SgrR family transcriptional regulator